MLIAKVTIIHENMESPINFLHIARKQILYSLFINTQCFIIKTVEIDTSNFKNDSKNGDLTYLTFVLVFKMRSICAFLTMFVLRSISISLCL